MSMSENVKISYIEIVLETCFLLNNGVDKVH